MNEGSAFLMVILTMTLFIGYLNFLVWFRYEELGKWVTKAKAYSEKSNLPFSKFYTTLLESVAYKWFARIILLAILAMLLTPFLIFLGILLIVQP